MVSFSSWVTNLLLMNGFMRSWDSKLLLIDGFTSSWITTLLLMDGLPSSWDTTLLLMDGFISSWVTTLLLMDCFIILLLMDVTDLRVHAVHGWLWKVVTPFLWSDLVNLLVMKISKDDR